MSELAVVEHTEDFHDTGVDKEQFVTMVVEGQLFGVPILQVQDIVEPRGITPVPVAPSAIAGVMNLRGRIVTVINLRRCLGLEDRGGDALGMGITVEHRGDLYTLLVDTIGDIRDLPRTDFEKPPATLNENLRRLSTGIFRLPDDLLVVLDVERVLDTEILMKTPPVQLKKRIPKSKGVEKKNVLKLDKPSAEDETCAADAPGVVEKTSVKTAKKSMPKKVKEDTNVVKLTKSEKTGPEAPAQEESVSEAASLFERIGGDEAVEAAVDIFYSKVMADDLLKPFFVGVKMDQQSFMQRLFLTGAFGGPQAYTGRSLREAHKKLVEEQGLGEEHFGAVAGHLLSTLEDLDVPADLIQEVMTIAASTHDDVLNL